MNRLWRLLHRHAVCPLLLHARRMRALADVVGHVKENRL